MTDAEIPLAFLRKMCIITGYASEYGLVAQLGERSVRIREVEGSNPFRSTKIEKPPKGRPFYFAVACGSRSLSPLAGEIPSGPPSIKDNLGSDYSKLFFFIYNAIFVVRVPTIKQCRPITETGQEHSNNLLLYQAGQAVCPVALCPALWYTAHSYTHIVFIKEDCLCLQCWSAVTGGST